MKIERNCESGGVIEGEKRDRESERGSDHLYQMN